MDIPLSLSNNADAIVTNLEQESIDTYLFLKGQFQGTEDIRENHLFQFVFRSFYRLDNAGLSAQMKAEYFELLQETRNEAVFDFELVCGRLYQLENLQGRNTLQFSFVTKMANIINETQPIYDSEVASMFGFRAPYNYKNYNQRLEEYLDFYNSLSNQYIEFVANELVLDVFDVLGNNRLNVANLPPTKKLDFLMWSAGKLKRKGLLAIF